MNSLCAYEIFSDLMTFAPTPMTNDTELPDEEQVQVWVEAVKKGDKEAFAHVYDRYFESIYRFVLFRAPQQEVDDLVEEIFIKAWLKIESYQQGEAKFSSWLFRVAYHHLVDFMRTKKTHAFLDENQKDERLEVQPQALASQNEVVTEVRASLELLEEPYKTVLTMRFLFDSSYQELSEMMQEREGNIRVMQTRGLKKFRGILESRGVSAEWLNLNEQ